MARLRRLAGGARGADRSRGAVRACPGCADDELDPPAGAKRVEDIAGYSDDPAREREVLEDYGYRYGWERFWGEGATDR